VSHGAGFANISGAPGEKFDLVLLLDLDRDGDLDVMTMEERDATFGTIRGMGRGLGVIWHENPTRQAARLPDLWPRPSTPIRDLRL